MPHFSMVLRQVKQAFWDIPLTRPFRFGMVELNHLRHLCLFARFDITTHTHIAPPCSSVWAMTGENLVPKWFEKNPLSSHQQDIDSLQHCIQQVVELSMHQPPMPGPYALWKHTQNLAMQALPHAEPLLRQLGVSMIERLAIDAWCRAFGVPLSACLPPPLSKDYPPNNAVKSLAVRHTVGMSDDLSELSDILQKTGIRRLKIKLSGNSEADEHRIVQILAAADRSAETTIERFTLDGNENYPTPGAWRVFLTKLDNSPTLSKLNTRLAWIEQPVHRAAALQNDMGQLLNEFAHFPHVIDESDAESSSLSTALGLGYIGTTHKNCKGVFKSFEAAHHLKAHTATTGKKTILSGEDLTIVAPWSQNQDLAAAALLGVCDIERNGHHFARGLSGFSPDISAQAAVLHPQLYTLDSQNIAHLGLSNGHINTSNLNHQHFGWAGSPQQLMQSLGLSSASS